MKKNLINLFHRTMTNTTKTGANQKKHIKKTMFSIIPIRKFKFFVRTEL